MAELAEKSCADCSKENAPLKGDALKPLLAQLDGWQIQDEHDLNKQFKFPDFVTALAFVNLVGEVAENEQHHPDITLTYGKVGIKIFSHDIDGLAEGDFVLAAKIDQLPRASD